MIALLPNWYESVGELYGPLAKTKFSIIFIIIVINSNYVFFVSYFLFFFFFCIKFNVFYTSFLHNLINLVLISLKYVCDTYKTYCVLGKGCLSMSLIQFRYILSFLFSQIIISSFIYFPPPELTYCFCSRVKNFFKKYPTLFRFIVQNGVYTCHKCLTPHFKKKKVFFFLFCF